MKVRVGIILLYIKGVNVNGYNIPTTAGQELTPAAGTVRIATVATVVGGFRLHYHRCRTAGAVRQVESPVVGVAAFVQLRWSSNKASYQILSILN